MWKSIKFIRLFISIILSMAVLASCGGGGGGGGSSSNTDGSGGNTDGSGTSNSKWTYMVYMGGDNNLSTAGLLDLKEMEIAGSDDNVNIVLQAEFSGKYTDFNQIGQSYSGQTLRFLVKKDNNINLSAGIPVGNLDMASPATLRDFIIWAKTQYPADHYALVIWDHGDGWKDSRLGEIRAKGAVQDDTSGSFMSLPQLAQGVRDSGLKLDIINFDACLMAMYETAYEFRGLADFMVFSEDVEPGDGDPYDTILSALATNPSMTSRSLATTIVDKYYEYYITSGERVEAITKSAVDMSKIDALHTQVVQLANGIVSEYGTVSPVVSGAQNNSQKYELPENHDLYSFASYLDANLTSGITKTSAAAVKTAVVDAIVANKKNGSKVANSYGLAIYAPTKNQISYDGARDDIQKYSQLACNTTRASSWLDAVNKMTENVSDIILKAGGFAFYVEWDTDADVDLYVWEPCGQQASRPCADTLYATWMGQTTPNGYFSGDSYETGFPEEYYVAKDYVEGGDYDVIIEYFENGISNYANVTLWYIDPSQGITDWTIWSTVKMDLFFPYVGDFSDLQSLNDLNLYSNWWYPKSLTRSTQIRYNPIHINSGQRTINFRLHRKKVQPGFADIKVKG